MTEYGQMMDFVVKEQTTDEETGQEVLKAISLRRSRSDKPTIIMVTGESGEGKSETVLKWANILLSSQGFSLYDYMEKVMVFTPFEYSDKVQAILTSKELKGINVLIVDEASDLLEANEWKTFISKSITYVNTKSRAIKPLIIFIISQTFDDVTAATRRSITYYCKCLRPMGNKVRFTIYRTYENDNRLDNIYREKRMLKGKIKSPNGDQLIFADFRIKKLPRELSKKYKKMSHEAKDRILSERLQLMFQELNKKYRGSLSKVEPIAQWYIDHPDQRSQILHITKTGKTKLKPDFNKMHEFTGEEQKYFLELLNKKLIEKGVIADVVAAESKQII